LQRNNEYIAQIEIPLHITGIWIPFTRRNKQISGSIGAGLLLKPTVIAEVEKCRGESCGISICFERHCYKEISVVDALRSLLPDVSRRISISIDLPVPLGMGYAVSAAIALSVAVGYGVHRDMTVDEAATYAHIAEIKAGTGLGDVVAMLYGRGLEIRTVPGGPGYARVENIPISNEKLVYSIWYGEPLSTEDMHRSIGERAFADVLPLFQELLRKPSLEVFLEVSRRFSIMSRMAPREVIGDLDNMVNDGLIEGWYAKKRVIVVLAPEDADKIYLEGGLKQIARKIRGKIVRHKIANHPLIVRLRRKEPKDG